MVCSITSIADATSLASPTTSTASPRLDRTPARTSFVVVDEHHRPGHAAVLSSRSSTSVPASGLDVITAVPPTRSRRPTIDSVRPWRSASTASRSKPTPVSRTEDLDMFGGDFGEHVDPLHLRVFGGVDHRFGCRAHNRMFSIADIGIPNRDHLDRDTEVTFDAGRSSFQPVHEKARPRRHRTTRCAARAPVSGRASPLPGNHELAAGSRPGSGETESWRCAATSGSFVRSDPSEPLFGEVVDQPPRPRTQEQPDAKNHNCEQQQARPG